MMPGSRSSDPDPVWIRPDSELLDPIRPDLKIADPVHPYCRHVVLLPRTKFR